MEEIVHRRKLKVIEEEGSESESDQELVCKLLSY